MPKRTSEQRYEQYKLGRAKMDVWEANETLKVVIRRFQAGEMDEIMYLQGLEVCKTLLRLARRDLGWPDDWNNTYNYHLRNAAHDSV
jgi:hypothetical protein